MKRNSLQFFRAVVRELYRAEELERGGWQRMRKTSRGFSMLEILVVLLIMGIVAAFALPTAISHLRDYRLHSDAQAIASYLNVVRMKAASQYAPYRLVVDINGGTYTMEELCGAKTTTDNSACNGSGTAPAYIPLSTPKLVGGTQYAETGDTLLSCKPASVTSFPSGITGDVSPCPNTVYFYFNTRGSPVDGSGNPMPSPPGGDVLYMQSKNGLTDAITVSLGGRVSVSTWSGSQ
ncbi:MAG: Tfp pilus assembly protein FimT/FimU, partial [Deltaproteobacteria bacterium]